jgi:hypothetical protein
MAPNYNASSTAGNAEKFGNHVHDSMISEFDFIDDFPLGKSLASTAVLSDDEHDDDANDRYMNKHSLSSHNKVDHGYHEDIDTFNSSVAEDDAELLFLWNASPTVGMFCDDEIPETSTNSPNDSDFVGLRKEPRLQLSESMTTGTVDLPDIVAQSPTPTMFHCFVDFDFDDSQENSKRKKYEDELAYVVSHDVLDYRSVTPEQRTQRGRLTSFVSNVSVHETDLDNDLSESGHNYAVEYTHFINDAEQFKENYAQTLNHFISSIRRTDKSRNMIKRQKLLIPSSNRRRDDEVEESMAKKKKKKENQFLFHSQNDLVTEKARETLLQIFLSDRTKFVA